MLNMLNSVRALKCVGIFLISIISFVYVISFFLIPFSDWDTVFYPLVGKGIFQYHILPYGYIFEHKPYLVYVFYYVWCKIEFFLNGRFAILSLISLLITSGLLSKFYKTRFLQTFINVFFGGTLGAYLSGNTEVIQIPITLASVIFLTLGIERKKNSYLIISALLASIVINVNYLSGCVLAPIFLYFVISKSLSINNSIVIIGSGFISIALIFMPFLISGHGQLLTYFSMQHHFLQNYSASMSERLLTVKMVIIKISLIYPILIIWFKNKNIFWNNMRARILTLWFSFSVIAAIMSGHDYDHYTSLFLIPAMAIAANLHKYRKISSVWIMLPFYLFSVIYMISATVHNINSMKGIERTNPALISKIVGNKKVLNIRSDHSLYYLANLETFDPFLFNDHIDIFFGKNAEEHYMQDLRQKPDFVLMPFLSCDIVDGGGINNNKDNICMWMNKNYHIVYEAYNHKYPSHITNKYFKLYEINK